MKEKKARVEDALHATRAAVEEGILPGGGVALLRASTRRQAGRADRTISRSATTSSFALAAAPLTDDRRQRRPRRRHRLREGARGQGERRLQRRHRRVRGPGEGRHHRPDQGHAHRAAERGQRGHPAADQRCPDRREAEGGAARRAAPATAATTTCTRRGMGRARGSCRARFPSSTSAHDRLSRSFALPSLGASSVVHVPKIQPRLAQELIGPSEVFLFAVLKISA